MQSEQAPASYRSWKQGELVEAEMNTIAEGVATRSGYELPQKIMKELLKDFLLGSDSDIQRAIGTLVDKAHTLAEGAGATALAGAIKHPSKVKGKKVAITISGGTLLLTSSDGHWRYTRNKGMNRRQAITLMFSI
ncbi:MAG: hypothetical protein Ct9H300mP11_04500 [Chloroflexota bacterium]|nr:MAG: hypothetical protein Ct9H300mP11_04500 [Chloroflexota bacterium]